MKILKRSKIISAVVGMTILCLSSVTSVYATPTPQFGYVYQNGVGNLAAWLNTASGVGYWSTYISGAANNWMYTGWSNPIYINFVSSNYGSNLDFHLNYSSYFSGGSSTLAMTKWFNSSGTEVYAWSSNYAYAEVHINDDAYRDPDFSNDQAQGTTTHEVGHALGLAHSPIRASIMRQTLNGSGPYPQIGRTVQTVQKVDNDAINILY